MFIEVAFISVFVNFLLEDFMYSQNVVDAREELDFEFDEDITNSPANADEWWEMNFLDKLKWSENSFPKGE